jgi:hypothetical protein
MIKISYFFASIIVVVFIIGTTFFSFAYCWAHGIVEDSKRRDMISHLKYQMVGQINDSTYLEWERISDTGETSRYYHIIGTIRYPKEKGYEPSEGVRIVQLPGCDWKYKKESNKPAIK